MDNYYTPNAFAPLHPITPARVNIWPPQTTILADHTMIYEQSYGASNGGTGSSTGITIGTYIIVAVWTALSIFVIIWLSRGYFAAGFHNKPPLNQKLALPNPNTPNSGLIIQT